MLIQKSNTAYSRLLDAWWCCFFLGGEASFACMYFMISIQHFSMSDITLCVYIQLGYFNSPYEIYARNLATDQLHSNYLDVATSRGCFGMTAFMSKWDLF